MENETSAIGAWFPKKDGRDFILNYDLEKPIPEGYTMVQPLHDVPFQRFDDKTQTWLPDHDAQAQAQAASEKEALLAEIAARDYRALKAVKLKEELDTLYPGESQWYRKTMQRIKELIVVLEEKQE